MLVGIYFVIGALSSVEFTNGAVTKNKVDFTSVVFPEQIQVIRNQLAANLTANDKCKGLNFCTVKPDNYPQELFNKMFKGKLKEPIFQPTFVFTDDRQADPDEVDNCDTKVTYEPLFQVKSRSGDWRTVIQAPEENYVQMVRLETCKEVGRACFTSFIGPPELQPFCKQKYSVWEFLVHDGENGSEKVKVDLPICCSCHYKNTEI